MKEVGKIWMNGKLVPFKNAKIHVLTHALHYSTAVFEGIRCYNTLMDAQFFGYQNMLIDFLIPPNYTV